MSYIHKYINTMYTLRTIDPITGQVSHFDLGSNYVYLPSGSKAFIKQVDDVDGMLTQNNFKGIIGITFDRDGEEIWLYENRDNFIMTEGGKTFQIINYATFTKDDDNEDGVYIKASIDIEKPIVTGYNMINYSEEKGWYYRPTSLVNSPDKEFKEEDEFCEKL